MSHYFHQNTSGTYQLVSDSADPYNHTPTPPSYQPPPWPQDLRCDPVTSFRLESRSGFTSNGLVTCYAEMDRSNTYGISTTDLNFIRTGLYKIMESIDRIQGRIERMSSPIQNYNHIMSKTSKSTSSTSVISPTKLKVCNPSPVIFTTPEIHMENCSVVIENEKRFSTNQDFPKKSLEGLDYKTFFDQLPLQSCNNFYDYTSKVRWRPIDFERTFCWVDEYVNIRCGKEKLVVAYYLFEKMFEYELNFYKLPWPPPHFYHIHPLPLLRIICQFKTWKPGSHVKIYSAQLTI